MTELRQANGRCPGTQNCRGTLLAILFSALWLSHPGGVGAQTSANTGSIKGQVVVVDATGSSYLPGAQLLCGSSGNRPPIDVVSSVQVVSNPFGSQYADSPGALSAVETKSCTGGRLFAGVLRITQWIGAHCKPPSLLLILAAGNGSRIAARSGEGPKPLVTLNGKTLLEHVMSGAREAGIERLVICRGIPRRGHQGVVCESSAPRRRGNLDREPRLPQGRRFGVAGGA
ncbi:MAG: NTP transferase domain-containing protein [Terracidiphilus sp.]